MHFQWKIANLNRIYVYWAKKTRKHENALTIINAKWMLLFLFISWKYSHKNKLKYMKIFAIAFVCIYFLKAKRIQIILIIIRGIKQFYWIKWQNEIIGREMSVKAFGSPKYQNHHSGTCCPFRRCMQWSKCKATRKTIKYEKSA